MNAIPDYFKDFVNETNNLMRDQLSRQRKYLERVRMATEEPGTPCSPVRVVVDSDINDLWTSGQIDQVTAVFLQSLDPDLRRRYLSNQINRDVAQYMQVARLRDPSSVPPENAKKPDEITIETRGPVHVEPPTNVRPVDPAEVTD